MLLEFNTVAVDFPSHRNLPNSEHITFFSSSNKEEFISGIIESSKKQFDLKKDIDSFSFQERVKAGNNETLLEPYPSFGEILEPFEKLIHKNDILVRYFSRENMEEQCVVKDFCSLLNIEIDKVVDLNESMPTSALKLLFNFNKLPLPIDGDKRIFEARQKMIEALSYAYRHEEKIDSQYFLDTVVDSQYAFLEKHFGITLKPDRATNDLKSLEDFMLDQNDLDLSYLDNLLDKLNVNSSFFQSIESKMIMLFFGTLGQWYQ